MTGHLCYCNARELTPMIKVGNEKSEKISAMKNNTEDNTISAYFIYFIPPNNTAIKFKVHQGTM